MSLNSEQKYAIEILRSLCISCTEPLSIGKLMKDYEETEGRKLDFTGFSNPTEMLRSSNQFILRTGFDGKLTVGVKLVQSSAHIVEMTRLQQKKKSKKSKRNFTPPNFRYQSRYTPQLPAGYLSRPQRRTTPEIASRALRPTNNNIPQARNRNFGSLPYQMPKILYQPQIPPLKLQPLLPSQRAKIQPPLPPYQSAAPLPQVATKVTNQPLPQGPKKSHNDGGIPRLRIVNPEVLSPDFQKLKIKPAATAPVLPIVQAPQFSTPQPQKTNFIPVVTTTSMSHNNQYVAAETQQQVFRSNQNRYQNPAVSTTPKSSVQNRIDRVKKIVSSDDLFEQPQQQVQDKFVRSVSNDDQKNQKCFVEVPFEWWDSSTLNVIDKLEQYTKLKQLASPEYKFFKIKEGKKFKFQCRVTIDGTTYSTYPEDFDTADQAKIVCAAKAIQEIKDKAHNEKYPLFEGDDDELARKMYECINKHKTGVFLTEIPNIFQMEYNQTIPYNFLNIIQFTYNNLYRVEETGTNQEIVFANENASLPRSDSLSSFSDDLDPNALPAQLPRLPWEETTWNLLCTYPESTQDFWCSLIGPEYHEKRFDLYTEIELSDSTVRPGHVAIGQHYVAMVHKCPYRVRAIETNPESNKVLCFFIDTGEEEWIQEDQIYVCKENFLQLPAQAVSFSLHGLEIFSNLDNISYHLAELQDRIFVAEILTTEEQFLNKEPISIVLYDTSTDDDINMNEFLLKKIKESLPVQKIDPTKLHSIIITGITDDGFITCYQKDNVYMDIIKYGIQNMVNLGEVLAAQRGFYLEEGDNFYLIYDDHFRQYVRAKLVGIDKKNTDNVIMELIDFGSCRPINKKQVIKLLPYGAGLNAFPPQALKIQLNEINTSDPYVVSLLRGLLKPDMVCLGKYKTQINGVPQLNMFYRSKGNLQAINETIKNQLKQMRSESPDSKTNLESSDTADAGDTFIAVPKMLAQSLPQIRIPNIGENFEVKVIVSQSPKMFYVQPEIHSKQFNKMMFELQKYCQRTPETMIGHHLEIGAVYAAYLKCTKNWCRVKLLSCFDGNHNKVYCCDYGCIDVTETKHMKKLTHEFRDLPEQAILARLYGIKPNNAAEYSTEAAHRFIELTKDKQFNSVVKEIGKQENTGDRILGLELIDRSFRQNEVFISQILINESLAVRINE